MVSLISLYFIFYSMHSCPVNIPSDIQLTTLHIEVHIQNVHFLKNGFNDLSIHLQTVLFQIVLYRWRLKIQYIYVAPWSSLTHTTSMRKLICYFIFLLFRLASCAGKSYASNSFIQIISYAEFSLMFYITCHVFCCNLILSKANGRTEVTETG
jgi:hypothetical protein